LSLKGLRNKRSNDPKHNYDLLSPPLQKKESIESSTDFNKIRPNQTFNPQTLINQESLKVSVYKELTLRIFHSINNIKQIKSLPKIPEEKKIKF